MTPPSFAANFLSRHNQVPSTHAPKLKGRFLMLPFFQMIQIGIEVAAMILLVVGLVTSSATFLVRTSRKTERTAAFNEYRNNLGRTLLLTLEILIAADIVKTVAVEQTFASLGQLGLLVLIRTFLSFALELELTGRWPWQSKPDQQNHSADSADTASGLGKKKKAS